MGKYTAIEPLLLKAGRVEPGEVVELNERQAEQLLEYGAVKPAAQAKAKADAEAKAKADAPGKLG